MHKCATEFVAVNYNYYYYESTTVLKCESFKKTRRQYIILIHQNRTNLGKARLPTDDLLSLTRSDRMAFQTPTADAEASYKEFAWLKSQKCTPLVRVGD